MVVFPNAKINLGLCITGKRNDGYHNIESVFYPVPINDILEVVSSEEGEKITFYGNKIDGDFENNLVIKAYFEIAKELIHTHQAEKYSELQKLKFHLHKIIPTGAGIGGGSADGSFALDLLNQVLDLNLSSEKLEYFALKLGSDCPFFIGNTPAIVKGRGEIIEPIKLDLSEYHLVLIHPGIHVSTAEAYQNISIQPSGIDWKNIAKTPVSEWKNHLRNDFEKTVFEKHPEIKSIKEKLYELGAEYAQMSGTGSAVYGLFKNEMEKDFLQKEFNQPSYSIFSCSLGKK